MPGPGAGLAVLLRPVTVGGAAADPVTCVGVAPGTLLTGHTSGTVRTHSWPAPAAATPQLIKELRVAGRVVLNVWRLMRGEVALYRGEQNPWVKGSACIVLEFALPPFSPPLPSVVEVSKQNRH